ncbi:hypothetical protein [Gracilibacillus sp. YIM 98692]|uniref:hypothetical protein n=1 Tax=Gracilibacillus sp. YIM 98692 TaxID=2663532 RepID=UPI0013D3F09E|nr:hypothetical protein [Gracilibacillus sp. YIM 98692]
MDEFFIYEKYLTDKQIAILKDLLEYRVMTTNMLRERFFNGKGRYVEQVLMGLRKDGFIKTDTLRRSRKGIKGYPVHQITEKGRDAIQRYIPRDDELQHIGLQKVKEHQMPQILLANEVFFEYKRVGWVIWDSRIVKKKYKLDYRYHIQGMVISKEGKRYAIYAFDRGLNENVVGKVQKEVIQQDKANGIHNNIFLFKGIESYGKFIDYGLRKVETRNSEGYELRPPLQTVGEIIIEPYTLHMQKLTKGISKQDWFQRLCDFFDIKITQNKLHKKRQAFETIGEYQGQEFFVVDLTDGDINKYHSIKAYSQSEQSWNNNRMIMVFMLPMETDMYISLDELPYVKIMDITGDQFPTIIDM